MRPSKKSINKRVFPSFKNLISQTKKVQPTIPLTRYVYSSLIISVLAILIVVSSQKNLPPQTPLFYGAPVGEEQLTTSIGLVIPGMVSLIMTGINTLITLFLENQFLQKSLILSSLAISVFSFVTTVRIILLVGSF
ncbi:MAG: hypothetical protein UT24_C0002G0050 [Candidatus Woesebacteria bacterium GW2011_GWB1_39_12]|uniref:Uncharacterized protein n=2 Tax=Candidatus Woeseibacteriota TaxID=1752722 RepID=A0A0G0LYC0_9BACT|nr:MAG: hypothetical protein UT23_C0021G0006 [Candidatus Woesebacteria bacterium GW2011_GWA1_39_12]KKR01787.1 MAG: hypothetical protein UT24_C0002G0050 [Candidatus Woesebacteria bacterium GW2011_GWB1_39_12]